MPTQKWPTPGCFQLSWQDTTRETHSSINRSFCQTSGDVSLHISHDLLEFEHFKATQQSHANYMIPFYNNRCYSTELCTQCRAPVFPSALSHLAINKQHTFTVSQTLDALTQNNSDRWRLIIWVPNASLSHKDGAVTVMQPLSLHLLFLFTQAETEALWGLAVILDGHLGFCQIER